MRVFFAIEFEQDIKDYLYAIQKEIKEYCLSGNFTAKDNFHLTLRFIGEQSQSQVEKLKTALKETVVKGQAFELKIGELGKFDRKNRKIIWLGLTESRELKALYHQLESTLVKYEYAKEDRAYSPHITLAREVKTDMFEELTDKIAVNNLIVKVKSISLMESTRIDNKLCYVPVAAEEFNKD
jgi:2'-5' RNA ligase